jgi:hypothetical protein
MLPELVVFLRKVPSTNGEVVEVVPVHAPEELKR